MTSSTFAARNIVDHLQEVGSRIQLIYLLLCYEWATILLACLNRPEIAVSKALGVCIERVSSIGIYLWGKTAGPGSRVRVIARVFVQFNAFY
ncbi:MAG: hypothetical protein ACLFT3_16500 [Cyclobacteriaceae bacterium]